MQLFFSYARPDRPRVDSLVIQLRQATGIEIWLDSDLVGGWPWWDKILGQLRSCNAVLAAVSRASVNSQACRAERDYATKLGKPILPVAVEHMPAGLIPTDVARLQIIDYTRPDETSAFRLAAAIFSLPKPKALPNPLPPPPGLPQTRFANLNDLIAARSLSMEEQLGILARLEGALAPTSDQEDRETATEMLSEMAKRQDLYETAARKMEALQAKAGSAAQTSSAEPQTSQGPSPSTPPPSTPPRGALRPRNLSGLLIRGRGASRRRVQHRSSLSPQPAPDRCSRNRSSLSPAAPCRRSRRSLSPPPASDRCSRNRSSLSPPSLSQCGLNQSSLSPPALCRSSLNRRSHRRSPRPVP